MAFLIFLILFGVKISTTLTSSSPCEETSNCSCIRNSDSYIVTCSKSRDVGTDISADYQPGISFQIQCKTSGNIDFSLLKGMKIGPVRYFGLKFCPLPKTTFKELMASLQITQVTQVDFKSYSELGGSLRSSHFEDLESVTQISLNNNGLTSLPENIFDGMPNLVSLSLWDNRLKSLPRHIFSQTPQLKVLELGKNQLVNLEPEVFKNSTDLRLLNLWSNQLTNLTRKIFADVPNLENLDLSSNGLESLPQDVFEDLAKLTALNLNHNKFTYLSSGLFRGTPSLEKLRLSYNKGSLRTFPDGFFSDLTKLKELTITRCNISTLPEALLWYSPNIVTLSFESNELKELPEGLFRDSKEVHSVDFSYNKLESLPDSLFSSAFKLRVARFSHNNLHEISSQLFRGLPLLKTINLEYNKLNKIDGEAFHSQKDALTKVNLSNNNLTFTDQSSSDSDATKSPLQYCYKLELVHLANNKIERIFEDWKSVKSLRVLDLSYNKIKKITKYDLFFASNDATVTLSNNEITSVDLKNIEQNARELMGAIPKNETRTTQVLINDNPITCDCSIHDLVRYYEGALIPEVRSLLNIDVGGTRCAKPVSLQYTEVSNLHSKDLNCSSE